MLRAVRILGFASVLSFVAGCDAELCVPRESTLGFFSLGDCVLADSAFFQGHEWLTYFGNRDLPPAQRFSDSEVQAIAEGNRRVDWPKELLVHMNASVVHYLQAITEYTDRPENQKFHFLLDDRNDDRSAAAAAVGEMRRLSVEAVRTWSSDRLHALTLLGRACHTLQDSYSPAHTTRDPSDGDCIVRVKAYIERADGYDSEELEYHGGTDDDTIGHTTTLDSIYKEGRDCHSPVGAAEVESCLSEAATRARLATRDYLGAMRRALAVYATSEGTPDPGAAAAPELDAYFERHFTLCP